MNSTVPKAELHCHTEGAANPTLVQRLAARHQVDLEGLLDPDGGYAWHDFASFLDAYGRVSSVFRTRDDVRALALDHFTSLAAAGTIYGEIFIAPDIAATMALIGMPRRIQAIATSNASSP